MALTENLTGDLETFLDTDEFAITATWTPSGEDPVIITGIFDNDYLELTEQGLSIDTRRPVFHVQDSEVSGIAKGDSITIGAVVYKIISVQPDGTGVTLLILSKDYPT